MVYKFFNKKFSGSRVNKPNYQLEDELHNQLLEHLRKEKFIHHLETIFGTLI